MLYLNQLNFPHIPYNHNVKNGGVPEERRCVATSGCGLCSLCMVVEHLTTYTLSIEECVKLSEESGANHGLGTDLEILSPIIAEKFGLKYSATSDKNVLKKHLQSGGEAIEIVIGDHDGKSGLFSHRRHYITLISIDGDEVCILDPSFTQTKYDDPDRIGRVKVREPFLYSSIDELMAEGDKNVPLFYLFKRA